MISVLNVSIEFELNRIERIEQTNFKKNYCFFIKLGHQSMIIFSYHLIQLVYFRSELNNLSLIDFKIVFILCLFLIIIK